MEDYLYHHGIKGQRWGVRRFQREDGTRTAAGKRREQNYSDDNLTDRKKYKEARNAAADKYWSKQEEIESKYKRGETLSKEDMKRQADNEREYDKRTAELKANYKKDRALRKTDIKLTAKDLRKNASTGEKLVFNKATHKLAAKYVVDNGMSIDAAMNKAKKQAWINTGVAVVGTAAYTALMLKRL